VHHCLNEIENCLTALPDNALPLKAVCEAREHLLNTRFDTTQLDTLHHSLDQVETDLSAIHETLSSQYFHLYQSSLPQLQMAAQE
jgi:uncharacterized alpha-E superfamily protein